VGTNTALADDPELTTRLWKGNNPTRMVVDLELKLPSSLRIFNVKPKRLSLIQSNKKNPITFFITRLRRRESVHQIVNALYQLNVQTVIVEGGARLLQSFIDEGMWDEARVITNEELIIDNGLNAPSLSNQKLSGSQEIFLTRSKFMRTI
jgi:diaminohydroxyphosphoribosylaminopyrimidine deaminase/5-amino-6-(5-phosphoribosylamino)uracil reductase